MRGATDTHVHNADYVIAPFATIEHTGHQLKFESKNAENALNSSKVTVLPCASLPDPQADALETVVSFGKHSQQYRRA